MTRTLPSVTVSDKGERKIKSSHPWVFADEVTPRGEIPPEDGGLCDVYSGKDRYLGTGFFNSHSKIRVRLFSDNTNDTFDDAFFRRRIAHAVDYRITVMGPDFDACRLIFGEADRFPGWTVDRFGDILVSEVLSLGIEVRRETLYSLLIDVLAERGVQISGIYERCDGALRALEGMDRHCGYWRAESYPGHANGTVDIRENGVLYTVDYINGQKT
ncbi:MAG: rRNA large subunit methyltransferase I, partial [Clostridiales bacterium]|nr:rRNA large subunit methyltransferase I [Clostridiales bacterium]